jgi:hypothetical protein
VPCTWVVSRLRTVSTISAKVLYSRAVPPYILGMACSKSFHEALKTVWRVGVDITHIGVQDGLGDMRLELCNCKKCGSTLAREMRRSEIPPPPPRSL